MLAWIGFLAGGSFFVATTIEDGSADKVENGHYFLKHRGQPDKEVSPETYARMKCWSEIGFSGCIVFLASGSLSIWASSKLEKEEKSK